MGQKADNKQINGQIYNMIECDKNYQNHVVG